MREQTKEVTTESNGSKSERTRHKNNNACKCDDKQAMCVRRLDLFSCACIIFAKTSSIGLDLLWIYFFKMRPRGELLVRWIFF